MQLLIPVAGAVVVLLVAGRLFYELLRLLALNRLRRKALAAARRATARPAASPRDTARTGERGGVEAELVRLDHEAKRVMRLDHTLTGTALAGLGLAGIAVGRDIGYGEWAVSLHTAGIACIVAGLGLALVGGVLRILAGSVATPNASGKKA